MKQTFTLELDKSGNPKTRIMTTTEEKNKVLAEFAGIVFYDDENQYYDSVNGVFMGSTLEFHTSYDWIMAVVEKIESTKNQAGYKYQVMIQNNHCAIVNSQHLITLPPIIAESKLLAIHEACYQFAVWYKENPHS